MALQLQMAGDHARPVEPDQAQAPIRVGLADDHIRFRRSLRLTLDRDRAIDVVADEADAGPAVRGLPRDAPDVLLLDLQLPSGASLVAIRQLREQSPGTEVVVLTGESNPVFAQRVLEAGALGYVRKGSGDAELVEAVHRAARGSVYVSPSVAVGLGAIGRERADGLSPRETEVLRLIAFGHTSAEIARELHVSRRTVDSHRANIHRKLGLRTRAELVAFAMSRGLLGN
jgi:two-component system response regulator NreC